MTTAQSNVCIAVSRHFSIALKKVRELAEQFFMDRGGESPFFELDLSNYANVTLRISCTKNTTALGKMFFHRLVIKSEVYADILNAFNNTGAEVLAFSSGGALMVVYPATTYNGVGGIFVRPVNAAVGYVFEPMANYLENKYPKDNYCHE